MARESPVISFRPRVPSVRGASIPHVASLALALAALLGGLGFSVLARSGHPPSPLAPINAERNQHGVYQLTPDERLNRVAAQYLDTIIERRCLCPLPAGDAGQALTADVTAALGMPPQTIHHAGLVISYDLSLERAVLAALGRPESGAALLDRQLTLVGIASATVQPDQSWLAAPVGGGEPDIDLTGYTLAVIVTAGEVR